ncbi:MAG TPA: SDR family oxidoreductase [Parafilimonas sp.]|nr:SDR family oxidoreductase [Parafilimonas sp.]
MENTNRFNNKHILITGAARGIGLEIARHFAAEGANLSLIDYHEENLNKTTEELKTGSLHICSYAVDVSDRASVFDTVKRADDLQPIDVLINNAGIASETPFLNIPEEEWKKIININLAGSFFVAQAVCQRMALRKKGVVINMSSKNGLDGEFGYAHYNASKGGIIMLTKTMALELAHLGIRVNAVCPGYLQTPMSMEIDSPEFVQNFVDRYIPLNRPGRVEDVAPLFLFLAGDESSFITGQVFIADGGQLAGQKPGNDLLSKINFEF